MLPLLLDLVGLSGSGDPSSVAVVAFDQVHAVTLIGLDGVPQGQAQVVHGLESVASIVCLGLRLNMELLLAMLYQSLNCLTS